MAYIAFSKGIVVGASGGIFSMTGAYITLALYDWAKTGQRQVGLMLIGVLCIINLLLSVARSVSMLGHLSRENNTPETAFDCISGALAAAGAQVNKDYLLSVAAVCGTGKGVTV